MAETANRYAGQSAPELVRTPPPFVGRREQLNWFTNCIQHVVAGHPHIVLVPGEAGLGKTRLLLEMGTVAAGHGAQVYLGRSSEELGFPYLPFIKVLSSLWEQVPDDVKHALGSDAQTISRFLQPDKTAVLQGSLSPTAQADHDKLQLFLSVSRSTIKLSQSSSTVIALDDFHWADQPSLDLLDYLIFAIADAAVQESIPLLIIGMYRPVEPTARLANLIARFQREEICQTLKFTGLDESEIYDFLQALGLARPSHQLVTTIQEATQGNPLFIQEVVHHLRQQHALRERGGYIVTTSPAAALRLPEYVTGAILARTQQLSEDCRAILTWAAFLGDSFALQSLRAVSGMDEETLLNLLEEGMQQGLLLSESQGFQFTHSLIHHVFYHEPSVARRQRLHLQIAQTLEQLYTERLDVHFLEIAHHLVRAGTAAEADKVATYARRAGDYTFTFLAWGEAARYYETALSVAPLINGFSDHDRAELHYRAGFTRHRDMDAGPCLDHYEKAIAAYRQTHNVRGLAQVLMDKARTQITIAAGS